MKASADLAYYRIRAVVQRDSLIRALRRGSPAVVKLNKDLEQTLAIVHQKEEELGLPERARTGKALDGSTLAKGTA